MHDYHSVREWISVQDMGAATATLIHLAQVWAEPESAAGAPGTAGANPSAAGEPPARGPLAWPLT